MTNAPAHFFTLIELTKYRSVVCLNGELPEPEFFARCQALPVVAVDGAANILHARKLRYDMVIGDLDSVDPEALSGAQVVALPDQATNDFTKALGYVRQAQLAPSIILGINGGYLDQVLQNLNIFAELSWVLYAPPLAGFMVQAPEVLTFQLPYLSKLSLFPMAQAVVTTTGLKWNLTSQPLSFPGANSCGNRSLASRITIQVESGRLLVLVYLVKITDAGGG